MAETIEGAEIISTNHPFIVRVKGICGGRPIIVGTRTPVRSIVGYHKMGMSVEDILEDLPHLKPVHVYDALSYYYDHQSEQYPIGELLRRMLNLLMSLSVEDMHNRLEYLSQWGEAIS